MWYTHCTWPLIDSCPKHSILIVRVPLTTMLLTSSPLLLILKKDFGAGVVEIVCDGVDVVSGGVVSGGVVSGGVVSGGVVSAGVVSGGVVSGGVVSAGVVSIGVVSGGVVSGGVVSAGVVSSAVVSVERNSAAVVSAGCAVATESTLRYKERYRTKNV
jgi:hypothetical protein